jgi:hypothetical protein
MGFERNKGPEPESVRLETKLLLRRLTNMRLMGISNRGLLVITLLVMCLWGIIFAERAIVRQAQREHQEFFRSRPISVPVRPSPGTPHRATPGRQPQSSDAINS